MRWVIALLIVANLALFFWSQHDALPKDPIAALPPPDVGRLEILTDRNAGPSVPDNKADRNGIESPLTDAAELVEAAEVAEVAEVAEIAEVGEIGEIGEEAKAPKVAETADAPKTEENAQPAETASLAEVAETASVPDGTPSASAPTTEADADAVRSVPRVAAEPAPGEDAGINATADQSTGVGPGADPLPDIDVAAPETPRPTTAMCAQVGPLTPDQADQLVSTLPVYITLLSDIAEEIRLVDAYYVMIPPLGSRGEGLRMLEALEQAGITDTWLFPRGQYRNAISLGLFSRQPSAVRWQREVIERGFDAQVVARIATSERRRLLLKNVDGGDIALSLPLPEGVAAERQPCP
jgi:hypothetical protein